MYEVFPKVVTRMTARRAKFPWKSLLFLKLTQFGLSGQPSLNPLSRYSTLIYDQFPEE